MHKIFHPLSLREWQGKIHPSPHTPPQEQQQWESADGKRPAAVSLASNFLQGNPLPLPRFFLEKRKEYQQDYTRKTSTRGQRERRERCGGLNEGKLSPAEAPCFLLEFLQLKHAKKVGGGSEVPLRKPHLLSFLGSWSQASYDHLRTTSTSILLLFPSVSPFYFVLLVLIQSFIPQHLRHFSVRLVDIGCSIWFNSETQQDFSFRTGTAVGVWRRVVVCAGFKCKLITVVWVPGIWSKCQNHPPPNCLLWRESPKVSHPTTTNY